MGTRAPSSYFPSPTATTLPRFVSVRSPTVSGMIIPEAVCSSRALSVTRTLSPSGIIPGLLFAPFAIYLYKNYLANEPSYEHHNAHTTKVVVLLYYSDP